MKKWHFSPVLTIETYFDFKLILSQYWSGLGLPTEIKKRLELTIFSKRYLLLWWFCQNLLSHLGFLQFCAIQQHRTSKVIIIFQRRRQDMDRIFWNLKDGKNLSTLNTHFEFYKDSGIFRQKCPLRIKASECNNRTGLDLKYYYL